MHAGPLLHRIDTAIRKNPYVLHRCVFLECNHGKIILRGKVDSYYQKQMVQEVLRNIDGIAEISNQLEVDDFGPVSSSFSMTDRGPRSATADF